jgi:hypothetical protein
MKTQFVKVSSLLVIAFFLMAMVIGNVYGFGMKSLTGGEKKEKKSVSIDSLAKNEADLCKRLYAALAEINEAQICFAKALDNKKEVDLLQNLRKSITNPNVQDSDALIHVMSETLDASEAQNAKLKEIKTFDDAKKRELQRGLVPYASGTANSVLLGKEFAVHLNSSKDAVKEAGITGAMKVKKKLAVTLKVGPKVPKLGSNLVSTTKTAIEIAQKANIPVDGAQKAIGDL